MAGVKNLMKVRDLIVAVEKENVEGSFVEAGVWRGGCSIMAKGVIDFANLVTDI